jgi:hypothetical protein
VSRGVKGGGKGGEVTQTLYAHMNKIKIKKKTKKIFVIEMTFHNFKGQYIY